MLAKLFPRQQARNWDVNIKCGVMVRTCTLSGETEYRDTKNRIWIPFQTSAELISLHQSSTELPV